MDSQRNRLRGLVWGGSLAAVIAVSVAVGASWLLYQRTITLLTDNLRERLLSVSITEAANINADTLAQLKQEQDWVKPEWHTVVTSLKRVKNSNPNIVFMYVFRKRADDPSRMEFVADAESINPYANTDADPTNDVDANGDGKIEPDGADKLQWPGQPYDEAADIPETFQAYNGAMTAKDLYEDSYGRVLTGYAPIKDNRGNIVAILATDIKADDFFVVTRQTLYPFVIFIFSLIAIIAVLAGTLIYIWDRRAIMLARLSEALEKANTQQESLLHFISHEIKGYLTKGQSAFASIVEGDYGESPPQMKTLAEGALKEMRNGVETVMNILQASNLKKGTVSYTKNSFDFKKAVLEIIDSLRKVADEKGLTLELNIIPTGDYRLVGDEEKVRRSVIRNLIDNAIRYTPSGSIRVSLSDGDKKIHFSVQDTGVGITEQDKTRLFTEGGHGAESVKVNVDSTGYGLYIAKQIVEAHGGTIRAESEGQGRGSTFIVELPAV